MKGFRIGIDTGGTFTDVVLIDPDGGRMFVTKVSSTPENPAIGFNRAINKVLNQSGESSENVIAMFHGTTVATNALLQGRISNLGLIVTKGFKHILEIARQSVPDGYGNSYFWVKPDRLVPLQYVFEVGGRLNFKGKELVSLDEDEARKTIEILKEENVNTIGVCLIHSYANPSHELRLAEIIAKEYPEATISISSKVLPEYREYERAVTTLVDAFVKPHMSNYLQNIKDELSADFRRCPMLVMQSTGGVLSAEQVIDKPITTALSGPAAGVLGGSVVAGLAGFKDVITLDAGGTSTDICLIENGMPNITTEAFVGPFPVRLPMIDIRTIGTGGGSIAWKTLEGNLNVGPISAGATPGPMCYPKGGDEPTITDANLVLGRLPAQLIGGEIPLSIKRSREGIAHLAERLDMDVSIEELASGIIEIANWNQANNIRQITIQRGIDPRGLALLSFGGSGPAQSPAVMELLEMSACLIPPNPGNLSAFGLLAVDWRTDHIITRVMSENMMDPKEVNDIYATLETEAREMLTRDGLDTSSHRYLREADLRYVGQSTEVRVLAPSNNFDVNAIDELIETFHLTHERIFGYSYRNKQKVEAVNFCLAGIGMIERPKLPPLETKSGDTKTTGLETRKVYFDGEFMETSIFDRTSLFAGQLIYGPSIIEEYGSTTVVYPDQQATIDDYGIIVIRPKKNRK